MQTVGVEMVGVFAGHADGVPFVVEQVPVSAFLSDGADESFRVAVRPWCPGGVLMTVTSSEVKTASNAGVYLVSRSRMRNRKEAARSPRSMTRLRAAWVVQAPVGWAVTPRTCTVRVRTSMTNRTYSRRRLMVSMWKKSTASSLDDYGSVFGDHSGNEFRPRL